MKLLFVTREAFPAYNIALTELFVRQLARAGLQTTFVARAASLRPGDEAAENGVRTVLAPPEPANPLSRHLGSLAHYVRTARRLARDHDAIQVRDLPLAGLLCLAAARRAGKPFFFWMSFPYPENDFLRVSTYGRSLGLLRLAATALRGMLGKWLLYRLLLPRCDHVFTQSEAMKDDLMARGVPADRVTPVPMAVSMARMDRVRPGPLPPGVPEDAPLLAYLGTMPRTRRIDFLIHVLRRLRETLPGAHLVLIGDSAEPNEARRLRDLADKAGAAGHVHITGWLDRTEAWALAARAHLALCPLPDHPAFTVASPTKAMEFQALGVPVLGTEHPEYELMRSLGAGLDTAPWDVDAFAKATAALLADRQRLDDMSRRGREFIRAHRTYEGMVPALVALYERLAAGQDGKGRAS